MGPPVFIRDGVLLLDDPALDDMRIVALHQSVDQAGAADQPHLSDRQGQGRTLDLAVQPAFGKQPVKAGGVCQLAGQLVFIEHSPPECLHLFGDCRELIEGLGQKVGGR